MKELERQLRDGGFIRRGDFILKSGRRSSWYFDIKGVLAEPDLFARLVRHMARMVDRRATCVAASGYGGIPLATAVAAKLRLPLALVREERKEHGRMERIAGYVPDARDRVAIIDDVYSAGTSIRCTKKGLSETKAFIIGCYVAVDRSGERSVPVRSLFKTE